MRALRRSLALAALTWALGATPVAAAERYDHRGALGLTVAGGFEYVSAIALGQPGLTGPRFPVEVGGTWSLSERNALRLAGWFSPSPFSSAPWAGAVFAGLRNLRGPEQWKTFFDFLLAVHVAPQFAVGARVNVGVQYDFLPVMGVYLAGGGQIAGGNGLRLGFELLLGLHFRTYVLE